MKRVLVIEDEENIRLMIRRFLLQQGFEVETAIDGQDAIDHLSDDGYDAVVLDLMMPRVSGIGVLHYLDGADPSMIARTVIATAYPGAVANSDLKRVCRVIRKPFELTDLLEAVQACVAA